MNLLLFSFDPLRLLSAHVFLFCSCLASVALLVRPRSRCSSASHSRLSAGSWYIVSRSYEADNKIARKEVSRSFIGMYFVCYQRAVSDIEQQTSLGDDVYHDPSTIAQPVVSNPDASRRCVELSGIAVLSARLQRPSK